MSEMLRLSSLLLFNIRFTFLFVLDLLTDTVPRSGRTSDQDSDLPRIRWPMPSLRPRPSLGARPRQREPSNRPHPSPPEDDIQSLL